MSRHPLQFRDNPTRDRRLRSLLPCAEILEARELLTIYYRIETGTTELISPGGTGQSPTSTLRVTTDPAGYPGAARVDFSGSAVLGVDYDAYRNVVSPNTSMSQVSTSDTPTPFTVIVVPRAGVAADKQIIATLSSGASPATNDNDIRIDPGVATINIRGSNSVTIPNPTNLTNLASDRGAPDCTKPSPMEAEPAPGISASPSGLTLGEIYGFDGSVTSDPVTLFSEGFGKGWGLASDWSSVSALSARSTLGRGFVNIFQPAIQPGELGQLVVVGSATGVRHYNRKLDSYEGSYHRPEVLRVGATADFEQVDEYGNIIRFHDFSPGIPAAQQGKFKQYEDSHGNQINTAYDTNGFMTGQSRVFNGVTENFIFTYLTTGPNAGLMETARLERTANSVTTPVRRAEFVYYGDNDANGRARNLKFERMLDADGGVIDTNYYRYYTSDGGAGYTDGMKFIFHAAAFDRLAENRKPPGTAPFDPSSLADEAVLPFADNYYEYDIYHRVTKAVNQGAGCSCAGSSGSGAFTYTYQTAPASSVTDINNWRSRTIETLPDANQKYYYYNYAGQLILDALVTEDGNRVWATSYRYDAKGRLIQTAQPSAVAITNRTTLLAAEANPDLLGFQAGSGIYQYLSANSGLIQVAVYATTTTATGTAAGDAEGYLSANGFRQGYSGPFRKTASYAYYRHVDQRPSINAVTYPVARATVYPNNTDSDARTTSYFYGWYNIGGQDTSSRIQAVVVVRPIISAGQNGPGTPDTTTVVYDTFGRPIWVRDADNFIHYTDYDVATGAVVKTIVDVDTTKTSDFTGLPPSWSTRIDGGLHLTTVDLVDGMGRTVRRRDAKGAVTHWVYKDARREIRTYRGWNAATGTTTGPVEVTREDRRFGYTDTITMAPAIDKSGSAGSFVPTGDEAIGQVLTLTRDVLDLGQRVIETESYFNLANLSYPGTAIPTPPDRLKQLKDLSIRWMSLGEIGVNYHATGYGYDKRGRLSRVVNAVGTITGTTYDAPGRAVKTEVGTNDADPQSPSFNMTKVAEYAYDSDGNLTSSTTHPGDGTERVTGYAYDEQNRLVATKGDARPFSPGSVSEAVNRQVVYLARNNLGEITEILQYDGDAIDISAVKPADGGRLRARTVNLLDDQGRVYLQGVFRVDQATGSHPEATLATRYAYDHRGNLVATFNPGGLATKARYDGAGRVVSSAQTDGAGGFGWLAASSIAADNILSETRTTHDAVGNPTLVATSDRFHNLAPGDGLKATYYNNEDFTGTTAPARVDPTVDFDWGVGSPDSSINPDTFSARWTGFIDVPTAGPWTFSVNVDDGARLWVNGQLLIDDLGPGAPREVSGSAPITLEPGRLYSIRLDYREIGGGASVRLSWSGPGVEKQVVPQARFHSSHSGEGLTGTYYNDPNPSTHFEGTPVTRLDPIINFPWNGSAPAPSISATNFSVRWTGWVDVPTTGTWSFSAYVDDGVRVWVNDQLVVDDFNLGVRVAPGIQSLFLEAGRSYAIRIDYFQAGGGAALSLNWSGPGVANQNVPPQHLHPDANPAPTARTSYAAFYHDAADRLFASVDVGTNGGRAYARPADPPARSDAELVTTYLYDASGWVAQVNDPRVIAVDAPQGIRTRYAYDALGRVTEVVANATADYTTPSGAVTNSANNKTLYTYDGIGHVLTATAVLPTGANSTNGQTTTYVYGVTKGSGIGSNAVTSNDLLAAVIQPDETTGGLPASSNLATHQTTYRYNALGQVVGMTDANGTVHAYAYDVLGRLVADAIQTLGVGVNGDVRRMETAYDTAGRAYLFTSYNAPTDGTVASQVLRGFNGFGQLISEAQQHNGVVTDSSPRVQYVYTEMGVPQHSFRNDSRLTKMIYPNGRAVHYEYGPGGIDDAISRISSVKDDNAGSPGAVLESYKYLGLGTVVERVQPQAQVKLSYVRRPTDPYAPRADGGDQYTGLDRFGRIVDQNWVRTATSQSAGGGGAGSSTVRLQYTYDRDGNATSRRDLVDAALSELYSYDGLNRLVSMKRGTLSASAAGGPLDTISSPNRQQAWTLDAQGNWLGLATDGGTQVARSFDSANQAISVSNQATPPSYSPDGNTLGKNGTSYTYDAWNRLASAGSSTYRYDALGRRITETVGTTTTDVYFTPDWRAIEDRSVTSGVATVSQYVLSVTGQVILRDTTTPTNAIDGSKRRFAQQNANGDTMATVFQAAVQERYRYDAYGSTRVYDASGVERTGNQRSGFRALFQGGRYDYNTGLYLFQHRDLDPADGTWMQRDPLGLAAGDMNVRRFVGNNPINRVDPSGLYDIDGHFYTTFEVAIAAGLPRWDAFEIAYYSQYPDLNPAFEATPNAKSYVWLESAGPSAAGGANEYYRLQQWRRDINEILHSLHGGNPDEVDKRRKCLADLIRTGNLNNMEKGLVIHALGDAYGHTKPDGSQYAFPKGHFQPSTLLFFSGDMGHSVDNIATNPRRYKQYVSHLYLALGGKDPYSDMMYRIRNNADGFPPDAAKSIAIMEEIAAKPPFMYSFAFNGKRYDRNMRHPTEFGMQSLMDKIKSSCGCK